MTAAERLELEVLEWLGLLPDSAAPNEEPDYEARLRRLGEHLHKKHVEPQEALVALALHYLTIEDPKKRAYWLGRARQLLTTAWAMALAEADAEGLGRQLEREAAG